MTNRHQPVLSRGTPTSTEEAMGLDALRLKAPPG
jgi:hypothetical protein